MPDRYRNDVAGSRPQPALEPVGFELGSFLAHTNGDVEIGYNSNLYNRTANPIGDDYVKLSPGFSLASDWGRDSVELSGKAELTRFFKQASQDTNEYWAHAGGMLELGSRITLQPTVDFSREAEPRGSSTNSFTTGTPVYDRTLAANFGVSYSSGDFGAEFLAAYRQLRFEPVRLQGIDVSQQLRDTDGIGGRTTFLYRIAPSLSGFVEAVVDDTHNPHPEIIDVRRAHGYGLFTGVRIDPTGLIAGEIAIGFRRRFFTGSDTSSRGFTYNIQLQYYPTELLTVSLKADQQYRNSGILAASAVLVNEQVVDLTYEMYRDLNLYLEARREVSNYRDVNARTEFRGIGLRAGYTTRRWLQLSAFARYETSDTNRPLVASQFDAVRIGIGIEVRR